MQLPLKAVALALPAFATALQYRANDYSSTILEEAAGKSWKDADGVVRPLETIMANAGLNLAVSMLWVEPTQGGNYGLDDNVELGRRAQEAGMKFALSMHLSDTWANPGQQDTPAAWQGLDLEDLGTQLYAYCRNVMDTFDDGGVAIEIVYIGNETPNGILYPVGEIVDGNYYNASYLLKQCRDGISVSNISPKPQIGFHLNGGAQASHQTTWYDGVLAAGPLSSSDYDIQAVSYYPCWGTADTIANFRSTIATMYSKYGKSIMLAETNWPQSCPDTSEYPFPSDTKDIPISVAGQLQWIDQLGDILNNQDGAIGFTYWEGAWLDLPSLGTECENMLLVDSTGKDLGGFEAIGGL